MRDKLLGWWIFKTETLRWKFKKTFIVIPNSLVNIIHGLILVVSRIGSVLLKFWIIGYCFVWLMGILNDVGWLDITPRQALTIEMHIENVWNVIRWYCEMRLLDFIWRHVDKPFNWIYDQLDKCFARINNTSNNNYYRRMKKANINLGQFAPNNSEVREDE